MNFKYSIVLILTICVLAIKASAQNLNCNLFCVTEIQMSPNPGFLNITIWNGDTNAVNYPVVQLLDNTGDTVANVQGDFFLFLQFSNSFVVHEVSTTLAAFPPGFTGTVLIKDFSTGVQCALPFPCATVNVDENAAESFAIYPNPASNHIIIERNFENIADYLDITMCNMIGEFQEIEVTANASSNKISFTNIPDGIYFIAIRTKVKTIFKKVVICR